MTIALSLVLEIALSMSPNQAHRDLAQQRAYFLRLSHAYQKAVEDAAHYKPFADQGLLVAGYRLAEHQRQTAMREITLESVKRPAQYLPALTRHILQGRLEQNQRTP